MRLFWQVVSRIDGRGTPKKHANPPVTRGRSRQAAALKSQPSAQPITLTHRRRRRQQAGDKRRRVFRRRQDREDAAIGRDAGWGAEIPEILRNENWNCAAFTADKQRTADVNQAECLAWS